MWIEIEFRNYRCFPDDSPARIVIRDGLTAFVGPNNAGKSTAMRALFELRQIFGLIPSGNLHNALVGQAQNFQVAGIADPEEIFSNRNDREIEIRLRLQVPAEPPEVPIASALAIVITRPGNSFTARLEHEGRWLESPPHHADYRFGTGGEVVDVAPYVEAARVLQRALYLPSVRNSVQVGATEPLYDLTLGSAFVAQWDDFKSGPNKRSTEAAIAVTDEIARIFGFERLEINAAREGNTLQVIADGRSFRLHELGSGLAQFIVALGMTAVRQPTFVLVDEPELSLHPSLQLDLLSVLARFVSHGILYSTHAIGLARASADFIYSVRLRDPGVSEISDLEGTPRLAEFAGELGYGAYREIGVDRLLLVEGPHELRTLHRLLRIYGADHRVVLLHLGGSSGINTDPEVQLLELTRITTDICVLIDSERDVEGEELRRERQRFVDACAKVGVSCTVLHRRALENYFPDRAIKASVGQGYAALEQFEKLGASRPGWGKRRNWQIAGQMTREDLDGTDLGHFLAAQAVGAAQTVQEAGND